jgi:N-acetylmuramoyl-L-alanine amidase-like protein
MSDLPLMPCVEPNEDTRLATLSPFAYLGTPKTLPEFVSYLDSYDFGPVKPDQLVIHNTANPDASWAPLGTNTSTHWDRDEADLSLTAIRNKRQKQLDGIQRFYASLGWDAGPHLFVDDRWIWLFTPMDTVGIHAKEGNSYRDSAGHLHYTLGIEVVGWYGKVGWPPAIQALLRGAVQALRDRLGTFEIVYKGSMPHQPARHEGSIAFHRDYNKPECPGAVITPVYAIPILKATPIILPPDPTPPDLAAAWGPIATPEGAQWGWDSVKAWAAHKDRLGQCRSHLLYDNDHHVICQQFEHGCTRQIGDAPWEACYL